MDLLHCKAINYPPQNFLLLPDFFLMKNMRNYFANYVFVVNVTLMWKTIK